MKKTYLGRLKRTVSPIERREFFHFMPVSYTHLDVYKRQGYGVQVDISIGTGYTAANRGFEIIYLDKCVEWYRYKPVHIYYYKGGNNNFADAEKAAERLLTNPSKILSKDTLKSVIRGVRKNLSAAAVFFMLYADTKKINTYKKLEGYSYNGTISVNHVTFTLGLYSGGISVGAGFTTSKSFSFSTGPSVMKFREDWTNDFRNISSSTLTKIKTKANKSYQKAITRKFDILSAK